MSGPGTSAYSELRTEEASRAPSETEALTKGADRGGREEWVSPVQNEPVDEEQRLQGIGRMMRALRAEWERSGSCDADTLYVPVLSNYVSDLGNVATERPGDADVWPGYNVWVHMNLNKWQSLLIDFAMTAAFEVIDLQSDITLALAICIDDSYGRVPTKLKVSFVVLTLLSVWLESGIALQQAWKARATTDPRCRNAKFLLQSWFLNWMAASVFLQIMPSRLCPYGAHKNGRNLGSISESEGVPVIMMGNSCLEGYLKSRVFLVRLPKVFVENICLFALTIWIQQFYVHKWSAVAILSAVMSTGSCVHAVYKVFMFLRDARRAKRWSEKAAADTQGFVSDYDKNFAQVTLSEGFVSCPLL